MGLFGSKREKKESYLGFGESKEERKEEPEEEATPKKTATCPYCETVFEETTEGEAPVKILDIGGREVYCSVVACGTCNKILGVYGES